MQVYNLKITNVKIQGNLPTLMISSPSNNGSHLPTIVVMHGLFGSKERNLIYGATLAEKGFLVVLPDAHMHGERWADESLFTKIRTNIVLTLQEIYDRTSQDLSIILDYLQDQENVDSNQFGITGISMGGMLSFISAITEPRFKAFAPIIGTGDFYELFTKSTLNI